MSRVNEWKARQDELRARLVVAPLDPLPRFVAGVDCAFTKDKQAVLSVAVVYDREAEAVVEVAEATRPCEVPYVPGYLSFREGPAVTAALQGLKRGFGAVLFDGQGLAHPRRCGLATHVGVELGLVSVGVAKSRLTGTHADPGPRRGERADLFDQDEVIGTVLRTRDNVKPLYVSVGNRVDLDSAARLVLACGARYRLPEPTRQADRLVAVMKRRLAGLAVSRRPKCMFRTGGPLA